MSVKDLVENIKHNGLLVSASLLEKLYTIAIENEQKLISVTEQRDALAAENAVIDSERLAWAELYGDEMGDPDVIEKAKTLQTPATDAAIASLRAEGVDIARNALIAFVEDEVGPNENVPGLIRGAEVCVSIARQLLESKGE